MAYGKLPANVVGWSTQALDSGFVAPSAYSSPDIICHKSASPAKASATVAAGGKVTLQWNTWVAGHKGPVMDYLAACDGDCSTVTKTNLKWFKIDGEGLLDGNGSPGKFATDKMMANNVSIAFYVGRVNEGAKTWTAEFVDSYDPFDSQSW